MHSSKKAASLSDGAKYAFMAGLQVAKLMQFLYASHLEKKQELAIFAVTLMTTPLLCEASHPDRFIDFLSHEPVCLGEILESFVQQYVQDPNIVINLIQYVVRVVIDMGTPTLAFPMICLLKHISKQMSVSLYSLGQTLLLEIEALIEGDHEILAREKISILKVGTDLASINRHLLANNLDVSLDSAENLLTQFLSTSKMERLYGFSFLERLDLLKVQLILKENRIKASGANFKECGIIKTFLIQKSKAPLNLETKVDKNFLKRLEIENMVLSAQICLENGELGASVRWLFTAMNRLCEFEGSSRYCFEHTFASNPMLKFNIRKLTAETLISLGYFDVAVEMIVIARQESEKLHSNGFNHAFAALELICRKQLGDSDLKISNTFLSELMSSPNRRLAFEALERVSDLRTTPKDHMERIKMYQDCHELALAAHGSTSINDLVRITLKQFLVAKSNGFNEQLTTMFERVTQLKAESEDKIQKQILISIKLNVVRNLLDKLQESPESLLQGGQEIENAKAELENIMAHCFQEKSYCYPILQECLRMRAALEPFEQGRPSKWIYFASKLAMTKESYKLEKMTLFEIDSSNVSRTLAYDLLLQNANTRSEALLKEFLSPMPNATLEDVMKSEDMTLVSPSHKVSGSDIAEQVQVFEKELDDPHWPHNIQASEQKLAQLLSLSDSGYKWGIDSKSFEIPEIPAGLTCIQWIQTTQTKDAWRDATSDDSFVTKSSLYRAYLYYSKENTAPDAQSTPILVQSRPIPSYVLSSLVKKADSLLISLKRWNVVKDDKFQLEAEGNWKTLLKTVSSFWNTSNAVLEETSYPKLSLISVKWLCYALDVRVGVGYGGDIAKLPTQDLVSNHAEIPNDTQNDQKDEQAIFFEWIVKQATQ